MTFLAGYYYQICHWLCSVSCCLDSGSNDGPIFLSSVTTGNRRPSPHIIYWWKRSVVNALLTPLYVHLNIWGTQQILTLEQPSSSLFTTTLSLPVDWMKHNYNSHVIIWQSPHTTSSTWWMFSRINAMTEQPQCSFSWNSAFTL